MSVKVKYGFADFELAVKEFEHKIISEVKRVVHETAELIVTHAKLLAPIDDGSLKDSINVTYDNDGLTAIITVGAHYAIYVEYGTGIYASEGNGRKTPWVYYSKKLGRYVYTRGMKPQPFFFPATDIALKHFRIEMNRIGV